MLTDDRPAYPMNIFARLHFTGHLDRTTLETAFHDSVKRHPLFCALVRKVGKNRFEWIDGSHVPHQIHWIDASAGAAEPRVSPIDLRREPGLRLWVVNDRQGSVVLIQAHHACCDGVGAFGWLVDMFRAYAALVGTARGRKGTRGPDFELLRTRGSSGLTWREKLGILGRYVRLVPSVFRTVRHRPLALVPTPPRIEDTSPADEYPASYTQSIAADEFAALKASASGRQVGLDELLVRDLFLALADWQSRHAPGACEGLRRIWVPMNLRTMAHRWLPATNMVGTVFFDRSQDHLADPQRLLDGLRWEMQLIRTRRIDHMLLFSMRMMKALTGSVRVFAPADRCTATCLLTYLGSPLAHLPTPHDEGRVVLGSAVLEKAEMLPPLRPYTYGGFDIFEYCNKMWVTLHYDPRPITRAQAEDLSATFLRHIRASI
jgi:hypothetical protein